jgi:hypothetical protein
MAKSGLHEMAWLPRDSHDHCALENVEDSKAASLFPVLLLTILLSLGHLKKVGDRPFHSPN